MILARTLESPVGGTLSVRDALGLLEKGTSLAEAANVSRVTIDRSALTLPKIQRACPFKM